MGVFNPRSATAGPPASISVRLVAFRGPLLIDSFDLESANVSIQGVESSPSFPFVHFVLGPQEQQLVGLWPRVAHTCLRSACLPTGYFIARRNDEINREFSALKTFEHNCRRQSRLSRADIQKMVEDNGDSDHGILTKLGYGMRKCLFSVLSVGPIPDHIAFIMDGNRRYAKKQNLKAGMGHRLGFTALMSMLKYCVELGVKHVTIYAFSIDNFKRSPEEVQSLMELLEEKMQNMLEKDSTVNQYGIRVHFAGDLTLLSESVNSAAQRVMASTSKNSKAVLSACIAYTSTDEIVRATQRACDEKLAETQDSDLCISFMDIERHLDLSIAPDPDIIIRTSGETRLSNFLLWQSADSLLYSPSVEWPEIGLRHLVFAVLNFQRRQCHFEKKKKH